jgi:acetyl esterase
MPVQTRPDTTTPSATLDPQTAEMLKRLYANPFLDPVNMTPAQMREAFDAFYAKVGLAPAEAEVTDTQFPAPGGAVGLRTYRPKGVEGVLPIVVFYLGGGLVMGSLNSYDGICRRLCQASGAIVVSVAYRQPPEHPFPAALDDSYAALLWARDNAATFGGDPERMAVAGESGGGMLAAVVTHLALDRSGPELTFQLLIYPAVGGPRDSGSMREFAEGFWFEPGQLDWLYEIYARDSDPEDPRISPINRHDFANLPPAYIVVANYDILRDGVLAYAEALQVAGVPVELQSYPTIHGFICMGGVIETAGAALEGAGRAIAVAFKGAVD